MSRPFRVSCLCNLRLFANAWQKHSKCSIVSSSLRYLQMASIKISQFWTDRVISCNYPCKPSDEGHLHPEQISCAFLINCRPYGQESGAVHSLPCCLRINPTMAFYNDFTGGLGELSGATLSLSSPSFTSSFALRFATLLCPRRLTVLLRIQGSASWQLTMACHLVILVSKVFKFA